MYIPDKQWDELNAFCCDLAEQLEAMPQNIFFACKKEATDLCYIILNMQDKPVPGQQPTVKQVLRDIRKLLSLK